MRRPPRILLCAPFLLSVPLAAQQLPPLPNPDGRGVHVLALAADRTGAVWAGTYGQGIYVLRPGAAVWEHRVSSELVHAFAFGARGEIWYGTIGSGWALSTDSGKTWTHWADRQHVAPNGIVTRGDTVYIATTNGIKRSTDRGTTWSALTDQYVLALTAGPDGSLWAGHLRGFARSADGGRTWNEYQSPARVRAILVDRDGTAWVGTEQGLYRFDPARGVWVDRHGRKTCGAGPVVKGCRVDLPPIEGVARGPGGEVYAATASGVFGTDGDAVNGCDAASFTSALLPLANGWYAAGRRNGIVSCRFDQGAALVSVTFQQRPDTETSGLRHTWFVRPIALEDQPYIDQTRRYGSTAGVAFNNPAGTPVHAIGDGVVVFAGAGEVAIRHDRRTKGRDGTQRTLFSVYSHNREGLVSVGQRVKAGDVIARVGDFLQLEIDASPSDSARARYTVNPELWIAPLPGTGVVAGQVWDADGRPVPAARVYGLSKAEPQETPYAYAETYGEDGHPDPGYQEHFAVSDVPPGDYTLTVDVSGRRLTRRVRVLERELTWVVFRADAH